jgi:hypothetical protein
MYLRNIEIQIIKTPNAVILANIYFVKVNSLRKDLYLPPSKMSRLSVRQTRFKDDTLLIEKILRFK